MVDIKEILLQWFINSLIKKLLIAVSKIRICRTSNYEKNDTNQLIQNFKKESPRTKYNHLL